MLKSVKNLNTNPIDEFTTQDTLYIQRVISGMMMSIYVRFIEFKSGIVTGEIIEVQPNNARGFWDKQVYYEKGSVIKTRVNKCYTYSKNGCHWFEKDGKQWKCSEK